ncbi:MAG: hypothetical protein COA33_005795 [Fluviicola sp.]|nr:hypothetical protein [Fluviicola sp.]
MRISTIIFLFLAFSISSQVLDNRKGNAFTDKPFFNEKFIHQNHIKQLSGYYVLKKKGELMKTTQYKYVYDFDNKGHLVSSYETMPNDGTKDTIWNKYEYDDQSNLSVFKKTDQDGFTSVYYEYDSLGRVISEEYKREIDTGNHIISRVLTFNKEHLKYFTFDQQIKRTRYNNYDLPYLDEFFNYNDLGYLVERIERVKMTSDVYTYSYEYNEKGLLSAIRKASNRQEEFLEELTFKYDELGNVVEKHITKNGVFTTDIQIIYNSKSKLVSSIITRQVSTGYMTILRFNEVEYFH